MQLLLIDEGTKVGYVQHEFNVLYPFLKIDFKRNDIKRIRTQAFEKFNASHKIDVDKHRTVAEIKKDFKDLLGLTIEIFRKSGNVWIETSLTDDWTLERQNREAEFLAEHTAKFK